MIYDARHIANWFIQRAKKDDCGLTITQLLKLVYIAHGWHLGALGAPLISNRIEAWQYGPVIPEVYKTFREDNGPTQYKPDFEPEISSDDTTSILNYVYDNYGKMGAKQLSDLTHEQDSPWHITVVRYGYFTPISNEAIRSHYSNKIKKYKENKNA